MRLIRLVLVIGILSVFNVSSAFAQDVSVETEISAQKVAIGSMLRFRITVHGETNIAPIQLPAIDGFHVQAIPPSVRISVVNGQKTISKSFDYELVPLKEGKYEIPRVDIPVAGKNYSTEAISVEVVSAQNAAEMRSQNGSAPAQERIFLKLKVPKQAVYVNERLPIKLILYIADYIPDRVQYPELNTVGFKLDDYGQPLQYEQNINGIKFKIIEFNTNLYPTRSGDLPLGPAQLNFTVFSTSSRLGSRNDVFNDAFFNSIFDRRQKVAMQIKSDSVHLTVLDLPEEGKPENFTGAVGQYDFNVSIAPTSVKVGDPITLRMTAIGEGNLSAIEMPSIPPEAGFKQYDPQIFEKDNIKKSEQVLIPKSESITEVPAIRFSYFDPRLKQYQAVTKGPFPITVSKLEEGDEFKVVGLENAQFPLADETFGKDIVFIKNDPGRFRLKGRHLYNSGVFCGLLIVFVILWSGIYVYFLRTRRIRTDIVYARKLQAPRRAKHGLAQAQKHIAAGKNEEFYDVVFKTIQQYIGNKLHLPSGAVTFENIRPVLVSRNVEENAVTDIKMIFDECDMIRYASAHIDQAQMTASYQRLAKTIDYLERHLK